MLRKTDFIKPITICIGTVKNALLQRISNDIRTSLLHIFSLANTILMCKLYIFVYKIVD